jgi:tRNA nucleotidyltransferase (CCA-adding enzyme)
LTSDRPRARARDPEPDGFRLPEGSIIAKLAPSVARVGGRLLVVGGWVRDRLNGETSQDSDFDLEIQGLSHDRISELLVPFGFSKPVGRHFPVWRQSREHIDVAYPRAGDGQNISGSTATLDSVFREASRHRDLTINSIGWDPIENRLIDPFGGRRDLEARILRAVSEETFGADPLRVVRVARLKARFEARVDPGLETLCRELELDGIAAERIASELRKILAESARPSIAFEFLAGVGQLEIFAPLAALRGVAQDPKWHPEGDVFVHTCMVVDRAVALAREQDLGPDAREILLFAALCHDLGKPETTRAEDDGRIRSLGHEAVSAALTQVWLQELGLGQERIRAVEVLVANHLAPGQFVSQGASARAYRRLARKLMRGGLTVVELERVARADHLGRTTEDALAGRYEAGESFLKQANEADIGHGVRPDVVSAELLMNRGIEPGPKLGRLLARCREIQDETGSPSAASIVERVLAEASRLESD